MTKLPIFTNEHPEICGPCGGKCCETFPGIPHPEDMGAPDVDALRGRVVELLRTGRWVVDHDCQSFLGREPSDWYLRPSIKGNEEHRKTWDFERGPCTFLRDGRCDIYVDRPRGCRTLIPKVDGHCEMPTSKIAQVDAWAPYQTLLLDAADEATARP